MADLASSATISSCCSVSSSASVIGSRAHASPSCFIPLGRSPRHLNAPPHFKAYLAVNATRPRKFSIVAVAGSATTVPSDYKGDKSPLSNASQPASMVDKPESAGQEEEVKDVSEYDEGRIRVCDKLIEVFMVDKTTPTDWRRLLAFSREWEGLRPHFYRRCQERADNEVDPGVKHSLLKLSRKLKEVDEDVQRHNELLAAIRKAPAELGEIVSRRRKDFTQEFFVHLYTVAQSYLDDKAEQNALAKLGNDCVAVVQAYDNATEDTKAINAAELKLQDIINSPSLDAACRKIDDLAQKNQLDSALVLMLTKAWSDAKETNMTKDEVKDILYHLYKTAVGNLQRLMPKEIRIVKHLLAIEDPEERLSNLNDAFTPGEELEGSNVDCLYTTPEKIHTWMKAVVDAYHHSREGTLIREARDLMNPKIIKKLEELIKLVEDHFM